MSLYLSPYQQFQVDRRGNILASDGYTLIFLDENTDTHHFVDNDPEIENGVVEAERSASWMEEQVTRQLEEYWKD